MHLFVSGFFVLKKLVALTSETSTDEGLFAAALSLLLLA